MEVDPKLYGFIGRMHTGYYAKVGSCNLPQDALEAMVADGEVRNPLQPREDLDFIHPLFESIQSAIDQIPPEERGNIRFVVTGHSQGGGLAQVALPLIINQFRNAIPGFVNNIVTPRFFGYFLSAPRVAADQETVNNCNALVGCDNMMNHFAFRDVVTTAYLRGYRTLGHLACDSARDVLQRAICSEISHNHRMFFLSFLKACVDPIAFDRSDEQHWMLPEDPELIVCWDEFKHLLSHQSFTYEQINPEGIVDLCNLALDRYRQRHGIGAESHFAIEQLPFVADYDWENVQRICRGDLFPHEIQPNEETCAMLDRIVGNIYGNTVTFSRDGTLNIRSLLDTVSDLLDAGRGESNPGGCLECLKRCFGCFRFLWPSRVESPFDFDPEFQELLESRGIDTQDMGIVRLGGSSLIAYLHYGSGANAFDGKLFDKFLPSRNLNFALMNGLIVSNDPHQMLHSEIKGEGFDAELYAGHSDDEAPVQPPDVTFRWQEETETTPARLPKCHSAADMAPSVHLPH
jgi:hypothetical protein